MNEDHYWMLMTYYCPTYGNAGKVEPIQVIRQEIYDVSFDKNKSKKDNLKSKFSKKTKQSR